MYITHACIYLDYSEILQGIWGPWSVWNACPAMCGKVGVQVRSRSCQSQTLSCSGPKVEGRSCNGPECPRAGKRRFVEVSSYSVFLAVLLYSH